METDVLTTAERNQSVCGENHQTSADPVTLSDEDDLEDEDWQLLELLHFPPVFLTVQSQVND